MATNLHFHSSAPGRGCARGQQPEAPDAPYQSCQEGAGVGNGEERLLSACSVLHRTREELECARGRKDWGKELRRLEGRVLGCQAAVRAIRRAIIVEQMGVCVGGTKGEGSSAPEQQELVKFLKLLLDVVETMMRKADRAGSDLSRRETRGRIKRALEIVAQLTPRVSDGVLVRRIQTFAAYYAEMLEAM